MGLARRLKRGKNFRHDHIKLALIRLVRRKHRALVADHVLHTM